MERQVNSLLWIKLIKRLIIFKDYVKEVLLLAVLSNNVGARRLLGYGSIPKAHRYERGVGDRSFCHELVSSWQCKDKVLRGLAKHRKVGNLFICLTFQPLASRAPASKSTSVVFSSYKYSHTMETAPYFSSVHNPRAVGRCKYKLSDILMVALITYLFGREG